MATTTSPVILDSTGQDIVTQLAAISAALASGVIITGNTDITLSGVLQGSSGKVAVMPVDNTPTDNSTNLVSSGGVKTALDVKVDPDQLAYFETGTTATKTGGYTAGEYISWKGTLYTANTNIAYGTALSAGTGSNLTECVGGGFNSVRVSYVEYVSQSDLTLQPLSNGFYDVTDTIPAGYTAIFATVPNPSAAAPTYVIPWLNNWNGEKRLNVFHIRNVQQTILAGTIFRLYIVKDY